MADDEPISDEIRAVIDKMKAARSSTTAAEIDAEVEAAAPDKKHVGWVEAPHPEGAMEVARQLFLIREQKKTIESVESQLSAALKVMIGNSPGLMAGGVPLAKVTRSRPTRVRADVIKEQLPPEDYPQLYQTSEQTTLYIDPEFKKAVWVEQGQKEVEK